MNLFTHKQQIAQGIFITLSLLASFANAAEQGAVQRRANSSISGAAIAAQPVTATQIITPSPAVTEAPAEKTITQPAVTPGTLQSLNPQPLPPGGSVIKPMQKLGIVPPGVTTGTLQPLNPQPLPPDGSVIKPKQRPGMQSLDMASPRLDHGIDASPRLIQPAVGIGSKTGAEKTTPYVRPDMAALTTPAPPGHITGASVKFTSSVEATLRIEGNGHCALNIIEKHGFDPIWPRRVDQPPSYIGPLPTQIKVRTNVVGLDSLAIEGAASPEGESCAGYASVRM